MRVVLPIVALVLVAFVVHRSHRSINLTAGQEATLHSKPTTPKSGDYRKTNRLNSVTEINSMITSDDWSDQIAEYIQRALNSTNATDHEEIITHLFPLLLSRNPAAAAALAQNIQSVPLREELFRQVARVWSQSDPKQAVEWASNLNNLSERENALTLVCLGIAETDPQTAMGYAQQASLDQDTGAMESLAQAWAAHDLNGALTWAAQLPASEQRDPMLARLAFSQAQSDPVHAATMVAEQISPGSVQDEAAISVLHQWALQDPTAAAAWLEEFSPGSLHDRGEQELASIAAVNN